MGTITSPGCVMTDFSTNGQTNPAWFSHSALALPTASAVPLNVVFACHLVRSYSHLRKLA